MRKEYGAALRDIFTTLLTKACGEFVPVKKHAPLAGYPGERAYCWRVSEVLFNWVVLVPDKDREVFFVELGWSRRGRFPQLTMRPSALRPGEAAGQDEFLCRLGELSRDNDEGWAIESLRADATQEDMMAYLVAQTTPVTPEVARGRVTPLVEQAVSELQRFGLPFLRTQGKSRNIG